MRGEIGIPRNSLGEVDREQLVTLLTRTATPYRGESYEVCALRDDDPDTLWVPRYFQRQWLWNQVEDWRWTNGKFHKFRVVIPLDPERGQTGAVPPMIEHVRSESSGILIAPTGTGKCLGLGTPVLLADGRVIPVESLVAGDRLMGPDGEPRTVLYTTVGRGPLYRIDPIKGEPWVCNDAHILTLVRTDSGDVEDVNLTDWLGASRTFKHVRKQFSVGIDNFIDSPAPPEIDPYFLGVWFGDGSHSLDSVRVSKPDPEIRRACEILAAEWGLRVSVSGSANKCPTYGVVGERGVPNRLLAALRDLVGDELKIPEAVMRGSRSTRLEFLAGFLDTDAELSCNCFFISQKREDWARAVWWIARSLGFCATITTRKSRCQGGFEGTYFVVAISGDVNQIPTRIPRKQAKLRRQKKVATRTGFIATAIGEGDYYGFTLDGDGRFLLGDFTVTHNTTMGYAIAGAFDRFIGIPVYVGHMLDHWVRHAKKVLGLTDDQIGIVQGDRCDLGRPVTVMMLQSLLSRRYPDELYEQIGFLICDEVHRYGAEVWKNVVGMFPAQYRLGLTATPKRKDGLDDVINWSFGSIGHRAPRIRSATVSPPTAYVLQFDRDYPYEGYCNWKQTSDGWVPDDPNPTKYDKQLAKDPVRNRVLAKEFATALRTGRRLLVLSSLVDHLETLRDLTWRFLEEVHPVERIVKNIPYDPEHLFIRLDTLEAGQKPKARDRVGGADCIFATYQMARDALDVTRLDTLGLATPPGNVAQPIGRLREKAEDADRRPLLVIDGAELGRYSQNKLKSRLGQYEKLGIEARLVTRTTTPRAK